MQIRTSGNRLTMIALAVIAGMTLLITSCEDRAADPVDMGYDYYPAEVGHWVIYDVDSVVYDDFTGEVLQYNYQVKELVESVFSDGEGHESLRLERFWRQDEGDSWQIKNVWQSRRLPARLEKTEENITYVKLTFPVRRNATWDGNAFNTKASQQYRITEAHLPYQVNGHSFDSTATVLQKQLQTLISEDFQQEVFARNVGMIYKKYVKLSKEVDGTIVAGVDYSYTISSFGMD
jgi:hypothetical protein